MTPRRPSELPLVLIVATMGFNNQILAYFSLRCMLMLPPAGERRRSTVSHPVTISAVAKTALPKENQPVPDHVVGISSHARRGVYRYVSRS